jgi:hypothetical protein
VAAEKLLTKRALPHGGKLPPTLEPRYTAPLARGPREIARLVERMEDLAGCGKRDFVG